MPFEERKFTFRNACLIRFYNFLILRKAMPGITDRRHSQPDQKLCVQSAVSHEIAVQFSLFCRFSKRILLQSEMIHSDFNITGHFKGCSAQLVQQSLRFSIRQVRFRISTLSGLHPWNMRITVKSNAVRTQADNFIYGFHHTLNRLQRQAINQVIIDRIVAHRTRENCDFFNGFLCLEAVNSPLDMLVEILYTQTNAAETFLVKHRQVARTGTVGVTFKTQRSIRAEFGPLENPVKQVAQVVMTEEGRRSTTKVNFPDARFLFKQVNVKIPVCLYSFVIGLFHKVIDSDSRTASAISTKTFAERKINIKADPFRLVRADEGFFDQQFPGFLRRFFRIPIRNGWITRVAWYCLVVFGNQFVHIT